MGQKVLIFCFKCFGCVYQEVMNAMYVYWALEFVKNCIPLWIFLICKILLIENFMVINIFMCLFPISSVKAAVYANKNSVTDYSSTKTF